MFIPTRSATGNHHRLRTLGLSALLLITTAGGVMAAIPGCRVAVQWEAARAQTVVARHAHHSAATLARWKIEAAAWSKAHHGQVYAGRPSPPAVSSWRPVGYNCDATIATEKSADLPLLEAEAMPEFAANASMAAFSAGTDMQDSLFTANLADLEADAGDSFLSGTYNLAPTGWPQGERFVGPFAPPLLFTLPSPHSRRLLPPHHPYQEGGLYPEPLPPPPVPTPEPSEIVLVSTALVALAAGAKFGMLKLERPERI